MLRARSTHKCHAERSELVATNWLAASWDSPQCVAKFSTLSACKSIPSPPPWSTLHTLRELWKCLTGPFWAKWKMQMKCNQIFFRQGVWVISMYFYGNFTCSPPLPLPLFSFSKTKAAWPQENKPPTLTSHQPAGQLVQPLPRHLRQTNKSSHLFDFTQRGGRGMGWPKGIGDHKRNALYKSFA